MKQKNHFFLLFTSIFLSIFSFGCSLFSSNNLNFSPWLFLMPSSTPTLDRNDHTISKYETAIAQLSNQLTQIAAIPKQPTSSPFPTSTFTPQSTITPPPITTTTPDPSIGNPEDFWNYSGNLNSGIQGPSAWTPLTYWRYDPQNWGKVPGYETCSLGKAQSPININTSAIHQVDPRNISIKYVAADMRLISNEFTFQADVPAGSYLLLDKEAYELTSFSFHSPAEHKLDGKVLDMEIQFFHRNASGQQIILSTLLKKGSSHAGLAALWSNLPPPPYNWREVKGFNPVFLLPAGRNVYLYTGSLTTPPCNENILWIIYTEVQELDAGQLAVYQTNYDKNARPEQPINQRTVSNDMINYSN